MSESNDSIEELLQANLRILPDNLTRVASLLRIEPYQFFVPVDYDRLQKANAWRESPAKEKLESIIAAAAWYTVLRPITRLAIGRLHKDKSNPVFLLRTGFYGNPERFETPKIRTMRPNAESEITSPYQTSAFPGLKGPRSDGRILPGAMFYRRTRIDEFPQAERVFKAKRGKRIRIAGLRSYTELEIKGMGNFITLRSHPKLGLPEEVQKMLGQYPEIIARSKPEPAIFSHQSFTTSKLQGALERAVFDEKLLEHESAIVDLRMVVGSLPRIINRVGAL